MLQAAKSTQDGELKLQSKLRQSAEASAATLSLELKVEQDRRLVAEGKVRRVTYVAWDKMTCCIQSFLDLCSNTTVSAENDYMCHLSCKQGATRGAQHA